MVTNINSNLSITSGVIKLVSGGKVCYPERANPMGNSMIIQNEFISIDIQTAGRRLASVLVQDKINGRSYDLGKDTFCIQLLRQRPTKPAPKRNTPMCASHSLRWI